MATACRIGSMTAHLPKDEIEALAAFGECFGVVFQIRDDVRDVLASEQELGKVPGQDLAEGIYTLPVIRALRDPGVSEELRGLLGRPLSPAEVEIARGLIMASSGIPASVSVARQFAEDAAIAAQRLGDGPVVKSLTALSFGLLEDLERSASSLTH
jgi:heptaprenyl diphosphate synthase